MVRSNMSFISLTIALLISGWLGPTQVSASTPNEQMVCLDPGHQLYGNNALEQASPDSKEMKAKVTSGTRGVKTKKPEYVLTLEASLLLKGKLEKLGYNVVMTRETHDVDISNIERAQKCNDVQADLAVRIHADGDNSPKAQGISVLYPASSKGTQAFFAQSKEAAGVILNEAIAATGAVSRGIVPRSDLTGFNWSTVPSVLIEMGFMTNPEEDEKLSDTNYLNQLTNGMTTGINQILSSPADEPEVDAQSQVYLAAHSQLFEFTNGKMLRTQVALSPQLVQLSATKGDWGKVSTWIGDKWVYIGQGAYQVKPVDKQVVLSEDAPFYRTPSDMSPAGRLSTQKINVHGQWDEWYLIETWMGSMWISAWNVS
ncbi:N-acetylmuramoyl-L-alanine amidase [Paenibacillus sp. UNC451MF]|uniref:N-acetylmuramoyl-L-alanine amidase n=1 Tax=Paenibacillus sp. UNC451MF TaxID=1449063 RepID=UPI0007E8C624|nr:N-acetylmuramoyl-L-alanine amidase [Paenibacillus sp. UNC451MF]